MKPKDERPSPPIDHFSLLAPLYERLIPRVNVEQLKHLLQLEAGHHLLDAGGGTGRVSRFFRGKVARICILDFSEGMLRQARAHGGFDTCRGVTEHLPFRDASFSRILAVDSFHHYRNQRRAAAELVRVLAPGGRMVIEEPDIRRFSVKLIALMEFLLMMRSHFYPPQAIAAMFHDAGGKVHIHEDGGPNVWIIIEK